MARIGLHDLKEKVRDLPGDTLLGIDIPITGTTGVLYLSGGNITTEQPLPVIHGGTGAATLLLDYYLVGNGTSPIGTSSMYRVGDSVQIDTTDDNPALTAYKNYSGAAGTSIQAVQGTVDDYGTTPTLGETYALLGEGRIHTGATGTRAVVGGAFVRASMDGGATSSLIGIHAIAYQASAGTATRAASVVAKVPTTTSAAFGGSAALAISASVGSSIADLAAGNWALYSASTRASALLGKLTVPTFQMTTGASNGYIATSDASGNLSWAAPAVLGANTALSNLASVAVNASLIPGADGTLDLGSGALRWRNGYLAGTLTASTAVSTAILTASTAKLGNLGATRPITASGGASLFASSSRFGWVVDADGFARLFDGTITAERTFTLPDLDGTVALTSVAGGGMGSLSHTAYAVLCGGTTSTGNVQSIASVGTSGQVLTSNGAGALPTFQAAAAGGITSLNTLTGATQTFTNDTNVTIVSGGTAHVITWAGTLAVARGGTGTGTAGIGAFNNITGYTAAGATGTTSTNLVFSTSPTLVTPALGTPSSGALSSCTAYPQSALTGLGTGVSTALGVNVGSAGAFVTFNGALGTPSSGILTNCTFPTLNQNTTGSAASLSISGQTGLLTVTGLTSTNRAKTVRDAADTILELGGSYTPTGTWTSLTMVTPVLGTPTSGTLTNATGLPISSGVSGLGSGIATFLATPSSANLASAVTDETGTSLLVFNTNPVIVTPTISSQSSAAGVTEAFSATISAAGASSIAGTAITMTASAAIAGTSNAGAAAGGSITRTTGAAARLTSGNADGGIDACVTGAGIGTGRPGYATWKFGAGGTWTFGTGANDDSFIFTNSSVPTTGSLQSVIIGGLATGNTASSTATNNVIIGLEACDTLTSGGGNVYIGRTVAINANTEAGGLTGVGMTAGATNVFIGQSATATVNTVSTSIAIGYQARVTASNMTVLGNAAMALFQLGSDNSTPTNRVLRGAGARAGTDTDTAGSVLVVQGGLATGTARSGDIYMRTGIPAATGSTAQSPGVRQFVSAKPTTLTESSATTVVTIPVASGKIVGGRVLYTIRADDGTDFQSTSDEIIFSAINKGGTVTAAISASIVATEITAASAGTLTSAWTAVANGNNVDLKCNAVSSLTQTTLQVYWTLDMAGTDTTGTVTAA